MNMTNNQNPESNKDKRAGGNTLRRFSGKISGLSDSTVRLLTRDIWDIEITGLPSLKRGIVRLTRIFVLVGKGFKNDECVLHASSLTFMTLLSFVPILALAVSMVRAVSYDESLREKTKDFVRSIVVEKQDAKTNPMVGNTNLISVSASSETNLLVALELAESAVLEMDNTPVAVKSIVHDAEPDGVVTLTKIEALIDVGFDKVEQLNFGALGGIGLIFLIWAVIGVLGDVEAAFNRVWGVVENRTLIRKFTDYLSVLIIFPLLGVAASSLPIVSFIEDKMDQADSHFFLSSMAGLPVIRVVWVVFLLTLAFSFLLRFTPNTNVKMKPGMIGGLVCAIGFAGWLKICLALQVGVAKYSAFFGSFAMVPIILSWVYVSWEILLLGAEVSYAVQNVDTYRMEHGWKEANQKSRILLAAALLREAAKNISSGDGLLNLREFNTRYRIPMRLMRDVSFDLVKCGVIVEAKVDSDSYAVRKDLEVMTVGDLVKLMLESGVSPDELGVAGLHTSAFVSQEMGKGFATGMATRIKDMPENVCSTLE